MNFEPFINRIQATPLIFIMYVFVISKTNTSFRSNISANISRLMDLDNEIMNFNPINSKSKFLPVSILIYVCYFPEI